VSIRDLEEMRRTDGKMARTTKYFKNLQRFKIRPWRARQVMPPITKKKKM